jgi:hypothetical protein
MAESIQARGRGHTVRWARFAVLARVTRIDPHKALLLYQDAMQAVKALVDYLREQLVTNDGWLQSP